MPLRILSKTDLLGLVDLPEAIVLMKQAFAELSSGEATVPQRIHMDLPDLNALSLVMPAYAPAGGHIGLKAISMFHDNPERNLPFIQGLMLLLDGEDGRPRALMDASLLTAVRTGAASGAATDLLANPDADVAAIIGPGVQGEWQLRAICAVRQINRVFVMGRNADKMLSFVERMGEQLGISVEAASQEQLREAQIVCAATTSATPVFEDQMIAPGTHINGVGSYKADMQEIPFQTVILSRVVVDKREAVLKEGGDIALPIRLGQMTSDHILAELGEVVAGKSVRQSPQDITFFKSVGNAVQDCVLAAALLKRAEENNIGQLVDL